MKNNNSDRYLRQISLPELGAEGQRKLLSAKVLIIGAGGLGNPALQYLVAAGVGTIGIADGDRVSTSNLHRQTLFDTADEGQLKAEVASKKLQKLNPEIDIKCFAFEITSKNAIDVINQFDIILDCTDNFSSRYLINDACALLGKPLIFGAVYRFEGQVAIFNCANNNDEIINYRDLFPEPPMPGEVMDCSEAGVLGVLPGMIGLIQANETIKLITGIGDVLKGRLLTFDILGYNTYIIELLKRVDVKIPSTQKEFEDFDYDHFCNINVENVELLDAAEFLERTKQNDIVIIDVREIHEVPKVNFPHLRVPLSTLAHKITDLDVNNSNIIFFCQSGKRSLQASKIAKSYFKDTIKISHLKNGIQSLLRKN